jgi:hypothetical protein
MRAVNHALTGAAIGLLVSEPVLAVPLAFVSHYVCDMIPHYGGGLPEKEEITSKKFNILLLIDFCLCPLVVLVLVLYRPDHWILAAVCAFVAASPDLFSISRYLDARANRQPKHSLYQDFATAIQWFERPIGAVVEVAWFIAMLIILIPLIRG